MESFCFVCGKKLGSKKHTYYNFSDESGPRNCCGEECCEILNESKEMSPSCYEEAYRTEEGCFRCEHFKNLETSGPRRGVWYNHICRYVKNNKPHDDLTSFACRDVFETEICQKIRKQVIKEVTRFELMDI